MRRSQATYQEEENNPNIYASGNFGKRCLSPLAVESVWNSKYWTLSAESAGKVQSVLADKMQDVQMCFWLFAGMGVARFVKRLWRGCRHEPVRAAVQSRTENTSSSESNLYFPSIQLVWKNSCGWNLSDVWPCARLVEQLTSAQARKGGPCVDMG